MKKEFYNLMNEYIKLSELYRGKLKELKSFRLYHKNNKYYKDIHKEVLSYNMRLSCYGMFRDTLKNIIATNNFELEIIRLKNKICKVYDGYDKKKVMEYYTEFYNKIKFIYDKYKK